MRALSLLEPYKLELQERPVPSPGPGQVLVQSRANGICGSDLHFYHGTHPYRMYPIYPGHEGTGRVAALGDGVATLAVGDAVVLEPLVHCGECYPCRNGRTNCCSRMKTVGLNLPGALSEFFVVPAYTLHKIPAHVPPHIAATVEPYSIGFQAVSRGQITADDSVAIIGAGPIGLTALAAAKARGARVAIMDLLDERLMFAQKFGADVTINSGKTNAGDILREWTHGDMPAVVIEAVGGAKTIELAISLVADAGRVVVVGVTEQAAQIRGVDMTRKELTIYGSRNNLRLFDTAAEFVVNHPDLSEQMVTHRFPLERAVEAYELAHAHPELISKIVIEVSA